MFTELARDMRRNAFMSSCKVLPDFNLKRRVPIRRILVNISYQISSMYIRGFLSCYMHTDGVNDGQTDRQTWSKKTQVL